MSAALGGTTVFRTASIQGAQFRLVAVPIEQGGATAGVLVIGGRRDSVFETLGVLSAALLLVVPITGSGLAIIAFVIARRALRPVHEITVAAQSIARGDLSQRIRGVSSRDEVGELADTFNIMIELLEATIERERRFTGDASHELRTPLTAMETALDVTLSQERSPQEYRDALHSLQLRTRQMSRATRQLLMLSRMDANALPLDFAPIVLPELIEAVLDSFSDQFPAVTLTTDFEAPDALLVNGDSEMLARAFSNVLENAAKHAGPTTTVKLQAHRVGKDVVVTVSDSGPGFQEEVLASPFERFRRGGDSLGMSGAGLGLAIVRSIVRLHGGDVSIANTPEGAQVRFRFLAADVEEA